MSGIEPVCRTLRPLAWRVGLFYSVSLHTRPLRAADGFAIQQDAAPFSFFKNTIFCNGSYHLGCNHLREKE